MYGGDCGAKLRYALWIPFKCVIFHGEYVPVKVEEGLVRGTVARSIMYSGGL